MRRNDVLTTALRDKRTPAVIGSIALSMSLMPLDAAQAEDRHRTAPEPAAARAHAHVASSTAVVVGTPAAQTAVKTHIVARGDTVSAIAAANGVRTADVLAWNGLGWTSIIRPGDVLRLGPKTSDAGAPRTPAAAAPASTYTVRKGDTLWAIAARHGMSVSALSRANDLGSSTTIHPGQKLRVGVLAASPAAASRPTAPRPEAAGPVHEVATGETLWAIAKRSGVSLARLLAANGLDERSIIYPGQKLRIPAAAAATPASTGAADVRLDAEQIANVKTIISVGRERGVSRDGIALALATAMVESWIRNLEGGDRDSVGLFQQRPSAGWGTVAEIRDPRRSAAAFFGGAGDPNGDRTRGLLDIDGWEDMAFGDAAQAVQISAYPERYGPWEEQAYRWLDTYG
ncbi:LysM peptidoglycan-binding domain-containing protein [Microbacterium sp. NPDC077663]|uniref:LysM peptidoglycan-binding domain-containing protein n=1 Tax=Microbacterium sp. NPDC077663 TaxID=3364189 RepID=UPI0037CA7AB1